MDLQLSSLNAFDSVMMLIIVMSGILAFKRGFISSVLGLCGWVFSVVLAYVSFPYAEPFLLKKMSSFAALVVGYFGFMVFYLLLFALLNFSIVAVFSAFHRGVVDQILGLTFGVLRGCFIIVVFFACLSTFVNILNDTTAVESSDAKSVFPDFVANSQSYPLLVQGREQLVRYMPESMQSVLQRAAQKNDVSPRKKEEDT